MNYLEPRAAFSSRVSRRQLLDLLGRSEAALGLTLSSSVERNRIPTHGVVPEPKKGEIILVWRNNNRPSEGQAVILVVPDGERHDFLAWASTYVGTHSPFTAFFRVLEYGDLLRFDLFEKAEGQIDQEVLVGLCGTAIAEAAIQTGFRSSRASNISLQSCQLTFSFAVLRSLAAGYHPAQLIELGDAWDSVRRATSGRVPPLSAGDSIPFWLLSLNALQGDQGLNSSDSWTSTISKLVRAARESDRERILQISWEPFSQVRDALEQFEAQTTLPRERQLRLVDEIVSKLLKTEVPPLLAEALSGYMIARLSNGSFDYLVLAADYKDELPSCALWFSLFAMWQKGFDALSTAASLGRHVALSALVERDVFARPCADVDAHELLLLSERKSGGPLRSVFGSVLEVELIPGVSSRLPNPARRSDDEPTRPQPSIDGARLTRLLREALTLVEGRTASEENPTFDSLFKPDSKPLFPKRRAKKKN